METSIPVPVPEVVLLSDPRVRSIPVRDREEPLVHLESYGIASGRSYGAASGLVRRSVATRLIAAQRLLPEGVRLLVVEGYRSATRQQGLVAGYKAELRRIHPEADEAELEMLSSRFVAPVDQAPHVAGAAVDLILVREGGVPLPMGTEVDATPEQSDGACYFDADGIDEEARGNRRMMAEALGNAGFVNYPTEWWHWSFGDRYWALMTGADAALFDTIRPAGGAAATC